MVSDLIPVFTPILLPGSQVILDTPRKFLLPGLCGRIAPKHYQAPRDHVRLTPSTKTTMRVITGSVYISLLPLWFERVNGSTQLVMERSLTLRASTCVGPACREQLVGAGEAYGLGAHTVCSRSVQYGKRSEGEEGLSMSYADVNSISLPPEGDTQKSKSA